MAEVKIELVGVKFHFGIAFLMAVNDIIDFNTVGEDPKQAYKEVPLLMYLSRKYACERKNLPVEFTQEDIYDLIDENGGIGGDFWNDFQVAFYKSIFQNVPLEETKKKVPKRG